MTAESIAVALDGRRDRSGRWRMQCPVHQGKSRSLSVTDRDGKVLVYCFGGCKQSAIIDALRGLTLWPEREQKSWTAEDRQAWGRLKREQEEAAAWGRSAAALAETLLEREELADRMALTRTLSIVGAGGQGLIDEFRAWRSAMPELTGAMVDAGRTSGERVQRQLATFLTELGRADAAA